MVTGAHMLYTETDTQVSRLLSPSRVLDQWELDRLAAPRSVGGAGQAGWQASAVQGGRPSQAGKAGMGSVRPDPFQAGRERVNHIRSSARIGLAVVIMVALLVVFAIPRAGADRGPVPTVSHVVQPGDTLWSIAELYMPATGDVRAAVSVIRSANGTMSGMLVVGDVIEVPVGEIPGALSPAPDRDTNGDLSRHE